MNATTANSFFLEKCTASLTATALFLNSNAMSCCTSNKILY